MNFHNYQNFNPIDLLIEDRTFQEKARKSFSTQFWKDIKDMGGIVSFSEGECELELSNLIKSSDTNFPQLSHLVIFLIFEFFFKPCKKFITSLFTR